MAGLRQGEAAALARRRRPHLPAAQAAASLPGVAADPRLSTEAAAGAGQDWGTHPLLHSAQAEGSAAALPPQPSALLPLVPLAGAGERCRAVAPLHPAAAPAVMPWRTAGWEAANCLVGARKQWLMTGRKKRGSSRWVGVAGAAVACRKCQHLSLQRCNVLILACFEESDTPDGWLTAAFSMHDV